MCASQNGDLHGRRKQTRGGAVYYGSALDSQGLALFGYILRSTPVINLSINEVPDGH
jgi:hypothetical protein